MAKRKVLSIFFLISFFLVACGENLQFGTGVSSGGTGMPTTIGSGTIKPTPTENLEESTLNDLTIWSQGPAVQDCNHLSITVNTLHPQTGNIMEKGDGVQLMETNTDFLSNLGIGITIQNKSSHTVLQYLDDCKNSISIHNQSEEELLQNEDSICESNEAIVVYSPGETKTFRHSVNLPIVLNDYNVLFSTHYTLDDYQLTDNRQVCEANYSFSAI